MAQINLLPWRETLREERKKKFLVLMVVVLLASGAVVLAADRYVRGAMVNQTARNEYLMSEIRILEDQVAEISKLQQQKREIQDRMSVIQNLQGSRPVIVRVFDELVKTLPDGVYFETLERNGESMKIVGVAESYSQLTTLMRRLDGSDWFTSPNLRIISAADKEEAFDDTAANRFNLNLTLVTPSDQDETDLSE
ncbi:MAG: PilN domain-containing protein [Gammaproteobacteria bacterium]|nr:PilN domain-containing protein [Pseudomonadales bacterium]MCP5347283.1 PilN domain-containing protein [Pseudomonadales bacterium]